jgi:hypothetical protein
MHCAICLCLLLFYACRTSSTAVQQPALDQDLSQLRAALKCEGVRVNHQRQQQQHQHQHQLNSSNLQLLKQQVAPAAAASTATEVSAAGSSKLHDQQIAVQLRETTASLSSLGLKLGMIDAQRSRLPASVSAGMQCNPSPCACNSSICCV